jgi:hypothetical protein
MSPTRRTVLGGLAGLVGLAGCGYRPGGGEFRWRSGTFHRADGMRLDGGTVLLVTREAMTFDFDSEQWYRGGQVATLDPERGERTAEYGFGTATLTAARGDGTVYAGRADGAVTAVPVETRESAAGAGDGDGERAGTGTPAPGADRWTATTGVAPSGVETLAADGDGRVYAGGSGGLAALSEGSVRWRWREDAVAAAVPGAGDTAVLALTGDRLVALAGDGSARWTHDVTPTSAGTEVPPPLVGPSGTYLADGGGVTALAGDGSVRWERGVAGPVGRPALTDDGLYHAAAGGVVRSFSPDGHERWAHEPRGPVRSRVAAADGRAFVLAGERLVGVGADGTAWRVALDEPEPFDPAFGPFAVGETLLLGSPGEVRSYWQSQLRR